MRLSLFKHKNGVFHRVRPAPRFNLLSRCDTGAAVTHSDEQRLRL